MLLFTTVITAFALGSPAKSAAITLWNSPTWCSVFKWSFVATVYAKAKS